MAIGKIKPGETPYAYVDTDFIIGSANTGTYDKWVTDVLGEGINKTVAMPWLYPKILNAGKKILVYSGDNDISVATATTQKWVADVGYNISKWPGATRCHALRRMHRACASVPPHLAIASV